MPSSIYFKNPALSNRLLQNRYQTEYLKKFCNDSKSVLYGHRQIPEHEWLEKRPVGSPSHRVSQAATPTHLRPPYASRLTYYDKMASRKSEPDFEQSYENTETISRLDYRSKTARPKQTTQSIYHNTRPPSEPVEPVTTGLEAINKMTLKKYRETSYENMIGPRVFFRPTIPPRRYDYVIHPGFHSEARKVGRSGVQQARPSEVEVRRHSSGLSGRKY